MKTTTVPILCGAALAAMSTAGISHWWSVRQFVAMVDSGLPVAATSAVALTKPAPAPAKPAPKPPEKPTPPVVAKTHPLEAGQKEFYEALISKIESLQHQNRDLLDQMAETNRELMKLEFRVDTHSEQFRPLPVSEDRPFTTSLEDEPGVLPPRAEPVQLPSYE
jgi:predicted RNase H-like nuclease (RuvC/YqgF family)